MRMFQVFPNALRKSIDILQTDIATDLCDYPRRPLPKRTATAAAPSVR